MFTPTLLIAIATAATAAPIEDWTPFHGQWTHAPTPAEEQARDAAVERCAEDFNVIIRPIAASRLGDAAWRVPSYKIAIAPTGVTFETERFGAVTTPLDGQPQQMHLRGRDVQLSRDVVNGVLQVHATDGGGSRDVSFSLPSANRLVATITVNSPDLDTPLVYFAEYRRAAR